MLSATSISETHTVTETVALSIDDILAAVRQRQGFDKGRAASIALTKARLSAPTTAIRREIDLDLMAGYPPRGRATRIARKLGYNRRFTARVLARMLK
jgi:hypothetical protein